MYLEVRFVLEIHCMLVNFCCAMNHHIWDNCCHDHPNKKYHHLMMQLFNSELSVHQKNMETIELLPSQDNKTFSHLGSLVTCDVMKL